MRSMVNVLRDAVNVNIMNQSNETTALNCLTLSARCQINFRLLAPIGNWSFLYEICFILIILTANAIFVKMCFFTKAHIIGTSGAIVQTHVSCPSTAQLIQTNLMI